MEYSLALQILTTSERWYLVTASMCVYHYLRHFFFRISPQEISTACFKTIFTITPNNKKFPHVLSYLFERAQPCGTSMY